MKKEKFIETFLKGQPLPIENIEAARKIEQSKSSSTVKISFSGQIDDIIADTAHGETRVRIYSPAGRGSFPAVLYLHGGGFSIGSPDTSDNICRIIAQMAGAVVISVDYGLAPEHKFPFALEECYQVVRWMIDNDIPLNIRSDKLAVAGDSAGGNLAAGICLLARQRKEFTLTYQVLICPVLDFQTDHAEKVKGIGEIMLTIKDSRAFQTYYLNEPSEVNHPLVSPLLAEDFSNLPPATVITAELDPLAAEGIAFAEKLKTANIAVRHRHYLGVIHDFVLFIGPLGEATEAAETIAQDLVEEFTKAL